MKQTPEQRRRNDLIDLSNLVVPPRLELDHPLVKTPSFRRAQANMTTLLKRNRMGVLDGPPGTGKTTFAQWAAEKANRPSVIVSMPENPYATDILRLSIVALTGQNPVSVDRVPLASELVDVLSEWQGLLVIDEVQNVGLDGLTQIRWVHDIVRPKLPFLLVGYGALRTVATNQPLSDRIKNRTRFRRLDIADVFTTVRQIAPSLGDAPDDLIRYANDIYAHGLLRRWVNLIEHLEDWEVHRPKKTDFADAVLAITADDHLDEEEDDDIA